VKKAIAILLAVHFFVGSLFPDMDYQRLLHMACAADHYSFHQKEALDNGTSFTVFDFVMDHYLAPANDLYDSENGHEEHPCSHSHNHTIDIAKLPLDFPNLLVVDEVVPTLIFAALPSLISDDFTSGLEEPPSFVYTATELV